MKNNLLKYLFVVLAIIASTRLLWADCYVEEIYDTILKVDTIYQTDTVIAHDTCYVVATSQDNSYEGSFGYDFLLPLFVSILGAFIALVLTYLLLRPNFEISPIATQTLNNRVWFVVRNKSCLAKLYSIKAELAYIRYNKNRDDIELHPIDLDLDNSITVLTQKRSGSDSFYTFHTKEAFLRDERFEEVRLRVSATNTISNIFDSKDRVFTYTAINTIDSTNDDIRWGTLEKDIHIPVEIMYKGEQLIKAKQIIKFNEKVMRIFVPQPNKVTVNIEKDIWEQAQEQLENLKPQRDLHNTFARLKEILPTINKINNDYKELKELYAQNITLTQENKEKRDKTVMEMKRNLVLISGYMQASINSK